MSTAYRTAAFLRALDPEQLQPIAESMFGPQQQLTLCGYDASGAPISTAEERPYTFNPLCPPPEFEGLDTEDYEHFLTPAGFHLRQLGIAGGMPIGWRLTASGREKARAAKGLP